MRLKQEKNSQKGRDRKKDKLGLFKGVLKDLLEGVSIGLVLSRIILSPRFSIIKSRSKEVLNLLTFPCALP